MRIPGAAWQQTSKRLLEPTFSYPGQAIALGTEVNPSTYATVVRVHHHVTLAVRKETKKFVLGPFPATGHTGSLWQMVTPPVPHARSWPGFTASASCWSAAAPASCWAVK